MNFLTSIRGLAALLVVFYHVKHFLPPIAVLGVLYPLFADGYLAVDFFLVLSGFIISYKYAAEFKDGVSANFLDFIARRLARIYPLHVFVMLCFLTLPIGLYVTGRGYDSSTFGMTSFVAKFFLVDLWLSGTSTWDTWNVPSWTISGELFAYLTFPLFVYLYQGVGARMKMALLAGAVALLIGLFQSFGCASIGGCIGQLGLLRCAVEFVLGIGVWFLLVETRTFGATYFKIVALVSIVLLVVAFRSGVSNYYFAPPLFASTLYGLVGCRSYLHDFLELRLLVYLGEISYSVYLTHLFLRDLLFNLFLATGEAPGLAFILFYVGVTLLFSVATYHWIEVPFRKRAYIFPGLKKAA
ncbi:MAG TPA: acyltransferase [Vicinamibacterales bacterium]|nr:acyltransferase [Vicinamibacterales bacterium]